MDYPFAALVGQEQLKTALLLNAVYPAIGGVLIRGEKGTAKSTAARSLAALLPPMRVVEGCPFHCDPAAPWAECPHCAIATERRAVAMPVPFVDLPLGATEDRVLGTLDFERALHEGRRAFQPGLLAAAHRGLLYIDEVNLLPDHLVDVLLDAAAMGVNTVQRESVSVAHPARFILIGTMNPEEGDLRPQLLDRFGLMVEIAGPRDPALRTEIVRRRLAFEADSAFATTWATEQAALAEQVVRARERLASVVLGDELLTYISQLCCEVEVDGLRGDLALHRTARAHASFHGRAEVTAEDVAAAAELVLPHRRKQKGNSGERRGLSPPSEVRRDKPGGSPAAETAERVFEPVSPQPVRRFEVTQPETDSASPRGRRNPAPTGQRGRTVRAVPDGNPPEVALAATVLAAARRGEWMDGRLQVRPEDLHRKERQGRTGTLLLFVVDASGSMAARRRMELVKGTVLGILRSAYQQRDEVAVIAFRGTRADILLRPTANITSAEHALRILPTGGRTPLAHALVVAGELAHQAQPDWPVLLILLSDGRANVSLPGTSEDPWQQALAAARKLASAGILAMVLDSDSGFIKLGRVQELAQALQAPCLALEDLSAETLVLQLRRQS